MALHVRRSPRFAVGLVALCVLQAGCTPKITAPPEPPYSVRRGDEAFRYQDYKGAISNYHTYLEETQKDPYTARVLYKTALAQYRLGRYDDTLGTLDQLQQRYPKGNWVQVDALRGDAERQLDKPMAALKAWDEAWTVANDTDRNKLRQRIASLGGSFDDVQLAQAQRIVTNLDVRMILEQQVAARQPPDIEEPMPEGEALAAEAAVPAPPPPSRAAPGKQPQIVSPPRGAPNLPSAAAPPAGVAAEPAPEPAAALTEEAEAPAPELPEGATFPAPDSQVQGQPKVACLLPMSGPAQALGERSLRGLRVLFGDKSDRLLVVDTGSDPAAAFTQVVNNPDVVAAIGPLRTEDAAMVAHTARAAQLPLLLLSQTDGLAGGSVLQVGMTRTRLVSTLLRYAMEKVHMQRFGILYPEDDSGKQYVATFRSEVDRRGGTIVGTDAYSPNAPVLPAVTLKRWRNAQHLQAIFLPDDAAAAQSVGQFLQRDMPDITLLGVTGWAALAGQDSDGLSGVLFSDGFYGESSRPGTQDFVKRFQAKYGEMPGLVEAQAYDAGLLAQQALQSGARSRGAILPALQGSGPIEGATGQLTVTRAGLNSQLFLLQVYDGKVQEVS